MGHVSLHRNGFIWLVTVTPRDGSPVFGKLRPRLDLLLNTSKPVVIHESLFFLHFDKFLSTLVSKLPAEEPAAHARVAVKPKALLRCCQAAGSTTSWLRTRE